MGKYLHMSRKRFLIDTAIVSGNSGGPVLDNKMRVVGIAATGVPSDASADTTDRHGVIPISTLKAL